MPTGRDTCSEEISEETDLEKGNRSFQVRKKSYFLWDQEIFLVFDEGSDTMRFVFWVANSGNNK